MDPLEARIGTLEQQVQRLFAVSDATYEARVKLSETLIRLEQKVEELYRLLEGVTDDGFHRCVEREQRIKLVERQLELLTAQKLDARATALEQQSTDLKAAMTAGFAELAQKLELQHKNLVRERIEPLELLIKDMNKKLIQAGAILGALGFIVGLVVPGLWRLILPGG